MILRNYQFPVFAALLLSSLLFSVKSSCYSFGLQGHNIIEANAYRQLLELHNVNNRRLSGKDILTYLFVRKMLTPPECFSTKKNLPFGCDTASGDILKWLPPTRSGDMDLILPRQFDQNSQTFHFMAMPSDVYNSPNVYNANEIPVNLIDSAYLRCMRFLSSGFYELLEDDISAKSKAELVYSLMHSIADSYSDAHAERDTLWRIVNIKAWQSSAWLPYCFHWSGWQHFNDPRTHHRVAEPFDDDYIVCDNPKCNGSDNPYRVQAECLTERAKQATAAIRDFLVTLYVVLQHEDNIIGRDTAFRNDQWGKYIRHFFQHTNPNIGAAVIRVAKSREDEREWRPLLRTGLRARIEGADARNTYDALGYLAFEIPTDVFNPFSMSLGVEMGTRYTGGNSGFLFSYPILGSFSLRFTEDFAYKISPAIFEASQLDTSADLLLSVFSVEMFPFRGMHVILEGPRYSFLKEHAFKSEWSLGVGSAFDFDIMEALASLVGASNPSSKEIAPPYWYTPDSMKISNGKIGPQNTTLYMPISFDFYSHHKEGVIGIDWQRIWDRDSSGVRRGGFGAGFLVGGVFADSGNGMIIQVYPLWKIPLSSTLSLSIKPLVLSGQLPFDSTAAGLARYDLQFDAGLSMSFRRLEIFVSLLKFSYRDWWAQGVYPIGIHFGALQSPD